MLKINSKKKVNKPANTLKPQFTQKKPLVQPEWNATNSDLDRYKLSKAEQVQKKVSLISKHRYEAKELWLQRQEKLKKGIVDEETQSVLETCLSTKRPPEKNMKNLTYFIKDDTYADYLDQAYEESEEKRLSVMDLHPQEKSEIKPAKVKEEKPQPRVEKKQDLDEGDDFIRKVNESLKDARDFMTKIERYPSITKPERALKALATSDKENNSRSSSSHAKKKPASISTNSTNLKSSVGSSQNGKKNLNSSSGFKETSPQFPKVEETSKPKYVEEEPPKEVYAEESNNNKEDISTYFKSLNQIEDTIKFLEENIIGGGNSAPEKKEYNYELPSMPKAGERFGFGFDLDDHRSPAAAAENKYRPDYSLEKSAEKEDSYFKKREASPSHSDIKYHNEEDEHEKEELSHDHDDHRIHDDHDDEQISFALTMKSNDQTERNLDHDHDHYDHHNDHGKPDYASKLFGFDDMISPVATTLQKPFPIALHSPPEYPQTLFENKAIQERTRTQNIKPQSPPKMETRPQAQPVEEEEEEEEDFNIERIKGLLQATKLEIEKMNTNQLDSYNTSYKAALEDMDKENVSNNRGGFGTTTYNKFDNEYKSDYPMGKKIEVVKNENFVTVKQPFNAAWENQRKVLADTRNMLDDDIPAPQTLDIKKHAVAATYSPKKFDDMPLNFRSFRK